MTFAAAWTVSCKTMDSSSLEATSQTGALLLMCSTLNVEAGSAWRSIFRRMTILFALPWWSHSYLAATSTAHEASVHLTSSIWSITWSDSTMCHWILVSVNSSLFCCLYSSPNKRKNFSKIMHNRILLVLFRTFLNSKIFLFSALAYMFSVEIMINR